MIYDKCGVFGIYGTRNASNLTYLGLYGLQHRGQESAGIVSAENGTFHHKIGMGLVHDVFSSEKDLAHARKIYNRSLLIFGAVTWPSLITAI
jgi:glutamine phosphoribosylpyrophosphate amidotransferase